MYEEELKSLGLTNNEIKIYLALLKHGIGHPTKLAEITGLHRSYIYDALERLLEKGLVNSILIENKKGYQAVAPRALREIFEVKMRQLDSIIPKLSSLSKTTDEETKIELYRGKGVYKTLIKDLISCFKKNDVVYILGLNEAVVKTVEPIYLEQYFNIIRDKNVKEKIIIATGGKKLKNPNLFYKELDSRYIGEVSIVIHNSRIFFFTWGDPYYLIVIDSQKISEGYIKQFNLLWKIAQ